MDRVLTLLLAGGAGTRLHPLTERRAKPAVPFGGTFRIVDIALSNCINSNLRRIYVLTQHRAFVLTRHIRYAWSFLPPELGEFIETLPPPMEMATAWYRGTADAVYQNAPAIEAEKFPYCLILGADHVYRMNYADLLARHLDTGAGVTLCVTRVAASEASRFGIVQTDGKDRVVGFQEKPRAASAGGASGPGTCLASMGIYLFSTSLLLEALRADAADPGSTHDFGKDVLPALIGRSDVCAFEFPCRDAGPSGYWRDIGTLEAYYEANMDLVATPAPFSIQDSEWPIRTSHQHYPPASFVEVPRGEPNRIESSLISPGCRLVGCRVLRSVIGPAVTIESGAEVQDSIVFPGARIGAGSRIRRSIVEQGVVIGAGAVIGPGAPGAPAGGRGPAETWPLVVTADVGGRPGA